MSRPKRQYKVYVPYHVITRSNNREWFKVPLEECWSIFTESLHFYSNIFKGRVHGFVLMSNHLHLLISFEEMNHSAFLNRFLTETSNSLNTASGRKNHVYGGRNRTTELTSETHYLACLKYIFRNPVRAGICKEPLEYPHSSLQGSLGLAHSLIINKPLTPFDNKLFTDTETFIAWLNKPTKKETDEAIRKGLRKREFKLGTNQKTKLPFDISDIY